MNDLVIQKSETLARTDGAPGGIGGGVDTSSRRSSGFYAGLCTVILSLFSALATALILTGLTPIVPTNTVVVTTLMINAVLVLATSAVVGWQLFGLIRARKRQAAGSRLHIRIVRLFSIIAVVPAILLATFAWISLDRGLDNWFSERTKSIIRNSLGVAEAYIQEHGQVIRTDSLAMARDLDAAADFKEIKTLRLSQQAGLRDIPLAYLIDRKGGVLATAAQSRAVKFLSPPQGAIDDAVDGQAVIIAPGSSSRVAAIKKLENFPNAYLYVARLVDPTVIRHLNRTRAGVAEYRQLEARRTGIQFAFGLMYLMIALTLLLAAVWVGLSFANRLVAPIGRLIEAAQKVSKGDLQVRVPVRRSEHDLAQLSTTFNRMISQLRIQRDELVKTNDKLTERRRFIEAVMSGVSAGVVGLGPDGAIRLANPSCGELLGTDQAAMIGKQLSEVIPEFVDMFNRAGRQTRGDVVQGDVTVTVDGSERSFAVQITREEAGPHDYGFVVTFDDITELVTAQRTSAWADVARRIAHEIKNPLTPIQLSAERIRRKYGKVITEDREVFERCTETIIRQVGDIGRMVDEFSSFARMPEPVKCEEDIREIARDVVFLFQSSNPEIDISVHVPDDPVIAEIDRRLVNQAITNLVKNATEAVDAMSEGDGSGEDYKGRVSVFVEALNDEGMVEFRVIDNGCGLPKKNRRRLLEPYITTRTKGTGIGLAVVQKVVEQHGGRLMLEDAPDCGPGETGTCIRLIIAVRPKKRDAQLSDRGNVIAENARVEQQENPEQKDFIDGI